MATLKRTCLVSLAAAALALSGTSAATAQTTITAPAGVPRSAVLDLYQSWMDSSAMPSPNIKLRVSLGDYDKTTAAGMRRDRSGAWYMRFPDVGYLEDEGLRDDLLASQLLFMHEAGHSFEFTLGSRLKARARQTRHSVRLTYRTRFARIMRWFGMPARVWIDGPIPLREQFAQAYAYCAVYPSGIPRRVITKVYWGYDYRPTRRQHLQACRLIRRAGETL